MVASASQIRTRLASQLLAERFDVPLSAVGRLGRVAKISTWGGARALVRTLSRRTGRSADDIRRVEDTIASLGGLKGLPMKIGQMLSYIPLPLPDTTRAAASVLLTHAQPIPSVRVYGMLRAELGARSDALLDTIEPTPIAVASIGQVHRARLPDGTAVAVKVQYPGMNRALRRDLSPAAFLGRVSTLLRRESERDVLVREAQARLLEECDYRREARQQMLFAKRFEAHPIIHIPTVHGDYSAGRVLTTTFVQGLHLHDFIATNPDQTTRDRAGRALFDFYFGSLFAHGVYNCDAHHGNYLFCPDGRVAIVDHGSTRSFDATFVDKLAALTRAMDADDVELLTAALVDLGIVSRSARYDRQAVRGVLRWFYGPMLTGDKQRFDADETAAWREVRRAYATIRGLPIPAEFLFLVRMRLGLVAALARLGARSDWRKLQREAVQTTPSSNVQAGAAEAASQRGTDAGPAQPEVRPESDAGQAFAPTLEVQLEPASEPTFNVVLVDPGHRVIEMIREVRGRLGVGLREAKDLIDNPPAVVGAGLRHEDAQALLHQLEALGAKARLRRVPG